MSYGLREKTRNILRMAENRVCTDLVCKCFLFR